jgi:hypothetical protein
VGAIEVNHSVGSVQNYPGDPQHVVRNNFIHDVTTAIRAGTGCALYNNVIWNVSGYGIYVDNQSNDSYTRAVYHNTIDAAPANAVFRAGGTQDVRNNIGPAAAGNLPTQDGYYVNKAGADYHLVKGAAPIDAGDDLTSIVPTDKDGVGRKANGAPDMGAYEYSSTAQVGESGDPRSAVAEFRSMTISPNAVDFSIPHAGHVRLEVFDVSGTPVGTLANNWMGEGRHSLPWNPQHRPSGMYLLKLAVGGVTSVQKETVTR